MTSSPERSAAITLLLLALVLMAVLAASATILVPAQIPSPADSGGSATRSAGDRTCSVLAPGCEVLENRGHSDPVSGSPLKEC